jgi:chromosome partitioning protein
MSVATIDLDIQGTLTNWYTRRPDQAPGIQHFRVPVEELNEAIEAIDQRNDLDLVIVDTPPGVEVNPTGIRVLIRKANLVLVPTGQGGLMSIR